MGKPNNNNEQRQLPNQFGQKSLRGRDFQDSSDRLPNSVSSLPDSIQPVSVSDSCLPDSINPSPDYNSRLPDTIQPAHEGDSAKPVQNDREEGR